MRANIGPLQLVMVENSHGYMYIMGPFHSTKTSGLNFRQLPGANGGAFSKISKNKVTSQSIPKFSKVFAEVFFPFNFARGKLEFSVELF